jgi:predicted component of type VI protein secretion system
MLLALSIISGQSGELGATAYKVFDERGGSIGRIAGNDWVLPDPQNFVSSRHARVSAAGGTFYLEDTSSNGTFINAPDQAASRGTPQPLNDGDRLYIGDYEIIVQIIPDEPQAASALGLGTVDPLAALAGTVAPPEGSKSPADLTRVSAAQGARPAPAAPPDFEAIVRLAVQGLVTVLRSRAEVKNSFRLPTTSVKAVENNPLKFSQNAEDAFDNLFVKSNPGYLGPVDAFREGFDDVAFHQSAMLAGIRAAFSAMLAKLHPEKLEELYERKLKRTAMLGLGNKAKYWEMYRAQFEEIDRDREAHFQLLFGEEFALAYNEHLQKLIADARLRKPR